MLLLPWLSPKHRTVTRQTEAFRKLWEPSLLQGAFQHIAACTSECVRYFTHSVLDPNWKKCKKNQQLFCNYTCHEFQSNILFSCPHIIHIFKHTPPPQQLHSPHTVPIIETYLWALILTILTSETISMLAISMFIPTATGGPANQDGQPCDFSELSHSYEELSLGTLKKPPL